MWRSQHPLGLPRVRPAASGRRDWDIQSRLLSHIEATDSGEWSLPAKLAELVRTVREPILLKGRARTPRSRNWIVQPDLGSAAVLLRVPRQTLSPRPPQPRRTPRREGVPIHRRLVETPAEGQFPAVHDSPLTAPTALRIPNTRDTCAPVRFTMLEAEGRLHAEHSEVSVGVASGGQPR